ncbi:hypothetical protein [Bradyrhizobium sp. LeoA1S1]
MEFDSKKLERSLNEAFATNDLQLICRAIDTAVLQSSGPTDIAWAAGIDRVTFYRNFRHVGSRGPRLATMIKVLRALGLQLVVETQAGVSQRTLNGEPAKRGSANKRNRKAAAMARRFTSALRTGEVYSLSKVYTEMLRAQENIAEFASKTVVVRESLYRVFSRHPTPQFGTLVSVFDRIQLQFAVRSLPHKSRFQA